MLPSPEKFASRVRKLGLGDGNRIVVYDSQGLFSAARVWWSFRVFGHKDVAVLDGGLPKWLAEGRPVDDIPPQPRERHFTARFDHSQLRSKVQMLANIESKRGQVLDARSAGRFHAREPEVWPGRRSGHTAVSIWISGRPSSRLSLKLSKKTIAESAMRMPKAGRQPI